MTRSNTFSFGHKPIFKSPLEATHFERLADTSPLDTSATRETPASDRTRATNAAAAPLVPPPPISLSSQPQPAQSHPTQSQAQQQPQAPQQAQAEPTDSTEHKPAKPAKSWSLKHRVAALMAVIAVPAMAAPDDFGELPGGAPTEAEMVSERLQAELARNPAMPFERPGMSFPGSAFFFLADPPKDALIALPELDALAEGVGEAGREVGAMIDAGPGATPFFGVGGGDQLRAQSCLAQAVWYEAASESEAGQRAVAQVVLNRVAHPSWPSSVCGVVYQGSSRRTGCQFTFTCDGSLRRKASGATWQRAQNIASDALSGSVYEPIGHATHYHTLWINPYWASSLDHVGTIGAHRFYRNRGAGGRKSAFNQGYAGVEPGVTERVTAAPSSELPALPAGPAQVRAGDANYAAGTTSLGAAQPGAAPGTLPATGPGAALIQPDVQGAGQVRDDFARSGQWKSDAARNALMEDQRRQAERGAQSGALNGAPNGSRRGGQQSAVPDRTPR